jgi:hypothetical protein
MKECDKRNSEVCLCLKFWWAYIDLTENGLWLAELSLPPIPCHSDITVEIGSYETQVTTS